MSYLRLRLNQINRLDRFVTTGHEPGHDNDPDTIFDYYQAEIAVESLTFIRARPQDNRCIVNASGIRTPYGLRTTIQQCKGLICILSTISHSTASRPVMVQGLRWLRWPRWLQKLRWPQCRVLWVYEISATKRHIDRTCLGRVRGPVWQQCRMSSGQYRVCTLGGALINTLRGVRVNIGTIWMCSKRFRNWSTSGQPSRSTYRMVWIVTEKWAGNGPWILGRCRQTHMKHLGSVTVSPLQCDGYVICDTVERLVVAIVAMNQRSLRTTLL